MNMLPLFIYTFYESFLQNLNILDTLSDVLDKCLRFSLIKSVSIFQAKPRLVASLSSVVYTFLLNSFN